MKKVHLFEIKMLDGSKYRGEIVYRDDKMLVLRINGLKDSESGGKVRLFLNGIMSIREIGWKKRF